MWFALGDRQGMMVTVFWSSVYEDGRKQQRRFAKN